LSIQSTRFDKTLTTKKAQWIYDLIGKRYDWLVVFDQRAKQRGLELLNPKPGEHILEVGVGTGKALRQLLARVRPGGAVFGIDISRVMLNLSSKHKDVLLCQADALNLPFAPDFFDCIYITYVLDLIPLHDLPAWLTGIRRVLRRGGRIVIVAMTEATTLSSQLFVSFWKAAFAISPMLCAGCRPIKLTTLLEQERFINLQREVIVQLAFPSEIVVGNK
jgi:ubiquinone/menaquinone biosynthesis C-methylase UbiE